MKKVLFFLAVTICITTLIYGSYYAYQNNALGQRKIVFARQASLAGRQAVNTEARKSAWASLKKDIAREIGGFKGNIGIVIKDLDMNWEINHNKDTLIPSASLVKIPVMLSYYYAEHEGKVNLRGKVVLKRSEKAPGSGVLKGASDGSVYTAEELIYLMITRSDNTAANILIDLLEVDTLNTYFHKLGLRRTNLSRKMMDFKARKAGVENYTTVGEMAYLLEKLYRGKFVNARTSKRCLDLLASQQINDRIPKKLPAGTLVAHKTGLERGLCHDVGIVYTDKGNFLICVLVKHDYKYAKPTKKLISKISLLTYNYYNNFN